jgi:hypothetical protein
MERDSLPAMSLGGKCRRRGASVRQSLRRSHRPASVRRIRTLSRLLAQAVAFLLRFLPKSQRSGGSSSASSEPRPQGPSPAGDRVISHRHDPTFGSFFSRA